MERIILYITILITAAFIIISKIFDPIWLIVLVLAILWYHREEGNIRPFFVINLLLFICYFVFHYFALLVPFIIGMGLSYILAPAVDWLERRRVPNAVAILTVLIPFIIIIPLIIVMVIFGLVDEVQVMISRIPDVIQYGQDLLGLIIAKLSSIGIIIDPGLVANTVTDQLTNILSGFFITIGQIGKGIRDVLIVVYNMILIPLTAYLFQADRKRIALWVRELFPADEQEQVSEFIRRLNISFAKFFRGQLLLMLVVGVIVGFALWILGIRYYLLLAIVAALANIIPNVGFILSFLPAILIGALSPSPWAALIKICAVYLGEQLLENFLLGPLIVGRASRLNPVVVMIVLVLGGAVFGVWGVIIAVPVAIFLREYLNYFLGLNL
jgi:predicted PurR-regulated permease PerM